MATGRIGTTPVLTTRWSKAPAAGTTSLSGLDDNSVSLVYSVGYEAVYQNGVLLSRGNDYTATNGTTITLTTATVAGDIIEVFANQTIPLADTYSQTVANGKFINNTLTTTTGDIIYASAANTPARLAIGSTDQVLKVSGGVPAWGAAPAASFVGCLVYDSTTQSISSNVATTITYDTEAFDTDGFHSTSSNTGRMTIPSGKAGKYLVQCHFQWDTNTTGYRDLRLYKNGSQVTYTNWQPGSVGISSQINRVIDLAVGDYVEMVCSQDSGGTRTIYKTQVYGSFAITYLGA
jgi:hypothetical protein